MQLSGAWAVGGGVGAEPAWGVLGVPAVQPVLGWSACAGRGHSVPAPRWPRLGVGPGRSQVPRMVESGWDRTGCRGGGGGRRAQLSLSLVPQEAREGRPVPHRARLRARHARGGGPLPAAAQGPEPADDRRVPGQPAEAVQPRCARVSGLPLPNSSPTHGALGTSSGAGVPPPLPQTHTDPRHLQPRPAGPAPPLVPWPPC